MSSQSDDQANVALYESLVARHGYDVQSLNWGSKASQQRRFQVLADIASLDGASILDVGCGLGDLSLWLKESGLSVDYTGIDLTPAMVQAATERQPGVKFINRTIFEEQAAGGRYDYVFSSGIFYLRQHEPFAYMTDAMAAMYAVCRRGVAFNTLSGWLEKQDEGEFYADPLETLSFCRTLTPRVIFRHDYHPGDFTVQLYRPE